ARAAADPRQRIGAGAAPGGDRHPRAAGMSAARAAARQVPRVEGARSQLLADGADVTAPTWSACGRPPSPLGALRAPGEGLTASLHLDADVARELAVLVVVVLDEPGEFLRRLHERRQGAGDVELLGEVGLAERLLHLRAQRGEGRLRQARRREQ